jgi:3-oxoacyl-[acyl-carrier-protein] synthase-1
MITSPRIVITGLGAICGSGLTAEAILEAIFAGKSSIAPIRQWDAQKWPVSAAAEIHGVSDSTLVADRKLHKFLSRTDLLGLYAVGSAVDRSGVTTSREKMDPGSIARFNDRSGVFVGSGGGAYQNNYDFLPVLTEAKGNVRAFGREVVSLVNPMWLLTHLPNNVLCYTGIRHGFKGTNACITNQCAGGALAIAEAAAAIGSGEADRAIAAGHDCPIEPESVLHYHRLGLLSSESLRPFDRDRSGTVFGEGAASVVLEKEDDARARGAKILGEFIGSGCTTEATGILAVRPDGDGVSRAIEMALENAAIPPCKVGFIVAHGNGTRASDASEAAAIRRVFGDDGPPVTAFKWAVGHTIAAAGALDFVMALTALRQDLVPGIGSLNSLDPELAPLPVSRTAQKPRGDIAMVICRGFGGMNVVLLVRAAASQTVE